MKKSSTFLVILSAIITLNACGPSVKLTGSWSETPAPQRNFSRILVMAIGKDISKRKMGEDAVCKELRGYGYNAAPSLDELGPDFANRNDSLAMQKTLLGKGFDGIITIRVLDVNEHDRWVPGDVYYGPVGFYRGFYGYYYRVWGYYAEPGYRTVDVEVLLESNLYEVLTGRLLWSGQSKAFTRDPTHAMAARYARNIVEDLIDRKVLSR